MGNKNIIRIYKWAFLLMVLFQLSGTTVYAANGRGEGFDLLKDCSSHIPTDEEIFNAKQMGVAVYAYLSVWEQRYAQKNEELNLVLIARAGTDPGNIKVLKNSTPLQKIVELGGSNVISDPGYDQPRINEVISPYMEKNEEKMDLSYSHMAIAYKDYDGDWTVAHMLYQCGLNERGSHKVVEGADGSSNLYNELLVNFFLDQPYAYKAQLIIPQKEIRKRLFEYLVDKSKTRELRKLTFTNKGLVDTFRTAWEFNNDKAYRFLNPKYNAASWVWSDRDQNSNQWPLLMMAYAMNPEQVTDRASGYRYLQQSGYQSSKLYLQYSPFYSLAKSFYRLKDTLDLKEQPLRLYDLYEVSTVNSVLQYLERRKALAQPPLEVELPTDNQYEALFKKNGNPFKDYLSHIFKLSKDKNTNENNNNTPQ